MAYTVVHSVYVTANSNRFPSNFGQATKKNDWNIRTEAIGSNRRRARRTAPSSPYRHLSMNFARARTEVLSCIYEDYGEVKPGEIPEEGAI